MPCEVTPEKRIEFVYGELPPAEAAAFEAHLGECESCRRECEEFIRQIELVDRAASGPAAAATSTDLSKIFATVRSRQTRSSRRWRRAATGAAAAALLIAIAAAAVRHVEIHATHVVIGWGEPALPSAPDRRGPAPDDLDLEQLRNDLARTQSLLAEQRRRLDELDRLAALVVSELKDDDARLARLTFRIDALKRQNDDRWQAVGRGFHGWYLTHVESPSAAPQTEFSQQGDLP